jgi:vitamin B12 transporter
VTAGLAAFRNDFDDLIQFDLLRGLPFNIGRARAEGLEAVVELRFDSWHVRADATLLDTEDLATGEPLPRRPERAANLLVGWAPARWDAAATLRWVDERTDVGGVPLAEHAVVDLALSFRPAPAWSPYLRLENALDRDYEEVAGFPAPGRRFVGGIAWRYGP